MADASEKRLLSLIRIGNSIHQLNRKCERELGLSLTQWNFLRKLIDMPGSSPQDLASELHLDPSSLTPTMHRLVKKKFVFVAPDSKDARKKQLSLTRAGRDILKQSTKHILKWTADAL